MPRIAYTKLIQLLAACPLAVLLTSAGGAQQAAGARPPIERYIRDSWSSLERSMVDCKSLVDPKTRTAPLLYLPAGMAEPPAVTALKGACNVQVLHLPHPVDHPGALAPSALPTPGLLYLPNPYVVPGGRFNEQYGWDSYFILLGLLQDGHTDLARGMVENFFFEIENYGNLLNANRTYFLTRSQPPLLSSMIRLVYAADLKAEPQKKADAWLATAYRYGRRDHDLWLRPEHRAGDTGLAHYYDLGEGPVPDLADASDYYPSVIRWLLAHPQVRTTYLADGPDLPAGATPTAAQMEEIRQVSCDPAHSVVCAHAHVGRHWLTPGYYKGDRADRESGFDQTFRFGPFAGSTQDYAAVGLNALLYKYELDLAWMATRLGKDTEATQWRSEADDRRAAMDKYLWSAADGMYMDWNYVTQTRSQYVYITTFYPLWAGAASPAQAAAVKAHLHLLMHPGGIAMSTTDSGVQWDLPYGWAPTTYLAMAGLERAGDDADAREIARRFMQSVRNGYAADGTIREKYDVVHATSHFHVVSGYKQNVIGFGWTNGVYERCAALLRAQGTDAAQALGLDAGDGR